MKVVVVGAGAMGGVWAARLSAAGVEVAVVDVTSDVVAAINTHGLRVQDSDGESTVRVRATSRPEELGPADVVFLFVKGPNTAAAAELARPLEGPDTIVVSLQNGWGNADVLARTYAPDRLVIGVSYHSATVLAPGHVAHTGKNVTFVGPYLDGAPLDHAQRVGALLTDGGIPTTVTPEVKTEIWKKLTLNTATLPTSALTGLRSGDLGEAATVMEVADALAAETVAVARALGYDIVLEERLEHIHAVLRGAGRGKGSMLQDVEAHRNTEIETINGAVVRAATEHGVDVPLNRAMLALVKGMELAWQRE